MKFLISLIMFSLISATAFAEDNKSSSVRCSYRIGYETSYMGYVNYIQSFMNKKGYRFVDVDDDIMIHHLLNMCWK